MTLLITESKLDSMTYLFANSDVQAPSISAAADGEERCQRGRVDPVREKIVSPVHSLTPKGEPYLKARTSLACRHSYPYDRNGTRCNNYRKISVHCGESIGIYKMSTHTGWQPR
jgi:hypothetical protein